MRRVISCKPLYVVLSFLLIYSCIEDKGKYKNLTKSKSKSEISNYVDTVFIDRIKHSNGLKDLFPEKSSIKLETRGDAIIGEISDLVYSPENNSIIILDSWTAKSVFAFRIDGRFLFKYGNKGSGPMEYQYPKSIASYKDKIVINDYDQKLLLFEVNGAFIKELYLSKKGIAIALDNMVMGKQYLYGYTNNPYLNIGSDGKSRRVFRIKDFEKLDASYGEFENTFSLHGGDIDYYYGNIIYTDVFNGNIYQIDSGSEEVFLFSSIGELMDVYEIEKSSNPESKLRSMIDEIDFIRQTGVIKDLLFIQTVKNIFVIDSAGNIIRDDIKIDVYPPKGYEHNFITTYIKFYNNGIILASIEEYEVSRGIVPNPTLLFYKYE